MAPPWPAFLSREARAWGLGPERPRRPYRTSSTALLPMRTVAWGRRRAWPPPPPWAFTRVRGAIGHRRVALDGAACLQKAERSSGERPSSAPWPPSAAAGALCRHRPLIARRRHRKRREKREEENDSRVSGEAAERRVLIRPGATRTVGSKSDGLRWPVAPRA